LSYQAYGNEKQQGKNNRQGSGSEYHREHAGNVEGYGQPHPVTGEDTTTNNKD
jgi:hypothetical protein